MPWTWCATTTCTSSRGDAGAAPGRGGRGNGPSSLRISGGEVLRATDVGASFPAPRSPTRLLHLLRGPSGCGRSRRRSSPGSRAGVDPALQRGDLLAASVGRSASSTPEVSKAMMEAKVPLYRVQRRRGGGGLRRRGSDEHPGGLRRRTRRCGAMHLIEVLTAGRGHYEATCQPRSTSRQRAAGSRPRCPRRCRRPPPSFLATGGAGGGPGERLLAGAAPRPVTTSACTRSCIGPLPGAGRARGDRRGRPRPLGRPTRRRPADRPGDRPPARCAAAVKSKEHGHREIGLNHALEAEGIRVLETDLGEYIVQLKGDGPAHIVVPASIFQGGDRRPLPRSWGRTRSRRRPRI